MAFFKVSGVSEILTYFLQLKEKTLGKLKVVILQV